MTEFLFRDDPALQACDAVVTASADGAVELDRTVFYAASGGQPGDGGRLRLPSGEEVAIVDTIHPERDRMRIAHVLGDGVTAPAPGSTVRVTLDWPRRHRLMRMHTALHLLSVAMPFGVTGGSIGEDKSRLDFDMPEPPEDVAAVEAWVNARIEEDLPVTAEWITEEALAAAPEMVKTMKVKPPVGQGRVRLIRIGTGDGTVDLQPCGGTHVARTGEIGRVRIGKIEKKGRENRRVNLHLVD